MSFLKGMKSVDFYKRLKRDLQQELTEASLPGASLSIVATVIMGVLVIAEFNAYLTPTTDTRVVLDHFTNQADDVLQINFNLSFPHLKCAYASVDASNFMGTHEAGISQRVTKWDLAKDGTILRKWGGRAKREQAHKHTEDEEPRNYVQHRVLDLEPSQFERERNAHQVLIVNFYAPWCHWCQKLEPVWTKAADDLGHMRKGREEVVLAKVDCTLPDAMRLCQEQRIDAFPTIMVFRKDEAGNAKHETFHGERSVDSIVRWADHFYDNIIAPDGVLDVEKDGIVESHPGVGCMISGLLHVQKAPGMIVVQAVSPSHNFNPLTMDVSHVINHLSYGPFLTEFAWTVLPDHVAESVGTLDDKHFDSSVASSPTTYEHYVKVVKHEIIPASSFKTDPVVAYGYVAHTNQVGSRLDEIPTVRINYDIIPVGVQITTEKLAFYSFVTNLCAIIGGVFTISGIIAKMVDQGMNSIKPKRDELGRIGK